MSDNELDAFNQSLNRRKWIIRGLWAAIFFLPVVLMVRCLTTTAEVVNEVMEDEPERIHLAPDDLQELRARIVESSKEAAKRAETFSEGFTAAAEAAKNADNLGRCPTPPPFPERFSVELNPHGYTLYGKDVQVVSVVKEWTASNVGFLDEIGGKGFESAAEKDAYLEELRQRSFLPTIETVVEIDKLSLPISDPTTKSFEPGHMSGIAYLWDHDEGTIVCTGRFEATSSKDVEINYTVTTRNGVVIHDESVLGLGTTGQLADDFYRNVRAAIGPALHRIE